MLRGKTNVKALETIEKAIKKQEDKGFETYGHFIEEADFTAEKMLNYAIEEATDLLIYLIDTKQRVERLQEENQNLKLYVAKLESKVESLEEDIEQERFYYEGRV